MNRGEATDAILDSRTTAVQVAILLGYVRHMPSGVAVEHGVSWPSAARLAKYSGSSRGTVVRQRRALIDAGVLVDAGTPKGGTPHLRIDFGALAVFTADKPSRRTPSRDERWGSIDDATPSTDDATGVSDSRTGGVSPSDGGCPTIGQGGVRPSDTNPLHTTLSKNPPQEPSAGAPAEPDLQTDSGPELPPGLEALPLWEQMDLPSPGKGCPAKLLTRDVLDVWAYWQRVHIESGRGKARVIGKDAVKAIHGALRWEPTSADECPEDWTVKRLLCTVLAYAYRAPAGSPGVDWWRKPDRHGSDLNPETLLRLGRDPKLPRNAKWAVAWSLAQRGPALSVLEGGKSPQAGPTAREIAERLWGEYLTADFENMGFRVQKHGVPPELFRSWADMTIQVVSMQALLHMRPTDQPFRKREYVAACEKWVRANLGAA